MKILLISSIATILILSMCKLSAQSKTSGEYIERLADAIRIEEGNNSKWLYGIHHREAQPLTEAEACRRCIKTINHALADFDLVRGTNFIDFLAHRYCPGNAKSWAINVKSILRRLK